MKKKKAENIVFNIVPDEFINKIIPGDSEIILKKIPENSIDIIITSPPYNFGMQYDVYNDKISWNEYLEKLYKIFDECIRVLKHGGRFIINIQPNYLGKFPTHHLISTYLYNKGLIWKDEIIWEKYNFSAAKGIYGSWKSPSCPYLKYTWEFIEIYCKESIKHYGDSKNIDISIDEFKNWNVARWIISSEKNMKKYKHPAMFPEKLVERLIKLYSYQNDIILDPFNGVGTTTFVAKKLNRRYIGIELSEDYCKIAEERLNSILII